MGASPGFVLNAKRWLECEAFVKTGASAHRLNLIDFGFDAHAVLCFASVPYSQLQISFSF